MHAWRRVPNISHPEAVDEFAPPAEFRAVGLVRRGVYIAVDGRQVTVIGCWQLSDMVKVETFLWNFEAHHLTPAFWRR